MACTRVTEALTCDAFLGGQLHLWQPAKGYRAGVDPVLLAATVPARAGESLLDIGCGAGAAALCIGQRVPGVELHGLELQPFYAGLARRNAKDNGISLTVHEGDVGDMPEILKARRFNHVITNPPYFDRAIGKPANFEGRETALGGADLSIWLEACARRLAPKGLFTLICRAERLPELLRVLPSYLGSLELWPITPRAGRSSELVLLRAKHSGRARFRLHEGLRMHEGAQHEKDGESYAKSIVSVLRDGAALPFPESKG
ncbi:methyltransferase [Lentibacter algarum]|nr:methyltransferase [Lentibacter algarum]